MRLGNNSPGLLLPQGALVEGFTFLVNPAMEAAGRCINVRASGADANNKIIIRNTMSFS